MVSDAVYDYEQHAALVRIIKLRPDSTLVSVLSANVGAEALTKMLMNDGWVVA